MTDKLGMHCYVSGKVQGVWYRASTKEQADRLGVNGWARNLKDGRVEVMAFGTREKLTQLHAWLQKGPPRAEVIDITYEEITWQEMKGFSVL